MRLEERKGAGGMRIGQWIFVAVLVIAAAFAGYALRGRSSSSQAAPAGGSGQAASASQKSGGKSSAQTGRSTGAVIAVQTATSQSGTLVAQRQTAGTVQPVTSSQVASQAAGVVSQVLANVGDSVKAGQAVIQLDDSQLRIAVQNAQLALQNARINLTTQTNATHDATQKLQQQLQAAQTSLSTAENSYASAQKVYALGGLSNNDLNNAKAALDTARANYSAAQTALAQNARAGNESLAQLQVAVSQAQNQLQNAQINLANATLRAPFAGQIAAINVTMGEAVGTNSQPFTLVSPERQVAFNVPPTDAASITPGQVLSFNTVSQSFQVKVNQRAATPINQNVPLTARILGNTLPPAGTVGTLSYSVRLAQGTLIPIAALQNDGVNNYVFVVEGGKAKIQNITVLAQAASSAAVSGVMAGQAVILNPPPGLLDGSSVTQTSSQTPSSTQGTQSPKSQPQPNSTKNPSSSSSTPPSSTPKGGGQP